MKKKNYLAPLSKTIGVTFEMSVCIGSPTDDLTGNISDPFSGDSVPDSEDEW